MVVWLGYTFIATYATTATYIYAGWLQGKFSFTHLICELYLLLDAKVHLKL